MTERYRQEVVTESYREEVVTEALSPVCIYRVRLSGLSWLDYCIDDRGVMVTI